MRTRSTTRGSPVRFWELPSGVEWQNADADEGCRGGARSGEICPPCDHEWRGRSLERACGDGRRIAGSPPRGTRKPPRELHAEAPAPSNTEDRPRQRGGCAPAPHHRMPLTGAMVTPSPPAKAVGLQEDQVARASRDIAATSPTISLRRRCQLRPVPWDGLFGFGRERGRDAGDGRVQGGGPLGKSSKAERRSGWHSISVHITSRSMVFMNPGARVTRGDPYSRSRSDSLLRDAVMRRCKVSNQRRTPRQSPGNRRNRSSRCG